MSQFKKKTHQEFIEEMKIKKPDYSILGQYISSETKILTRHDVCGYIWEARPASLSAGFGCPKCGKTVKKTQDEFESEMYNLNKNIKILGKYITCRDNIDCECLVCGYKWSAPPINLLRNHGCPSCSGRVANPGVNDFATMMPHLSKYLLDQSEGYKYRPYSHHKTAFVCPYCGCIDKRSIHDVVTYGFNCKVCNDNISYPNKYLRGLLMQCDLTKLTFEFNDCWTKQYRYDAYFEINNKKYIVEMDGSFHYEDNRMNNKSASEIQEIDRKKDLLANRHNITVIRIDSRVSKKEYIKNNIINSELKNIFDLSQIDFDKCNEIACSNYIYDFCKYYETNKYNYSINEICKIYGISLYTFINYYEKGIQYNWCK